MPGGAKAGDIVENLAGAGPASIAGEVVGAAAGEGAGAAINAAVHAAAGLARDAGAAIADGARGAGDAIYKGVQELQNMNQGPCNREDGW